MNWVKWCDKLEPLVCGYTYTHGHACICELAPYIQAKTAELKILDSSDVSEDGGDVTCEGCEEGP